VGLYDRWASAELNLRGGGDNRLNGESLVTEGKRTGGVLRSRDTVRGSRRRFSKGHGSVSDDRRRKKQSPRIGGDSYWSRPGRGGGGGGGGHKPHFREGRKWMKERKRGIATKQVKKNEKALKDGIHDRIEIKTRRRERKLP